MTNVQGDEKLSCQDKPTHQFLGRRLIYFHHIINSTKRETVMRAAVDLKLGGYSKIGRYFRVVLT